MNDPSDEATEPIQLFCTCQMGWNYGDDSYFIQEVLGLNLS
jgi:hypothetical protein